MQFYESNPAFFYKLGGSRMISEGVRFDQILRTYSMYLDVSMKCQSLFCGISKKTFQISTAEMISINKKILSKI